MAAARRPLVTLLFFLSGLTGLVYEVLWARHLGVVLGNAAHAHAVVLATFMGGLALGNAWLGRLGDRTPAPLRLYGLLELGVAAIAGLSPWVLGLASAGYLAVAPDLDPAMRGAAKALVAAAALLPATILMGGTLPILARHAAGSLAGMRAAVAGLYGLNGAGAALGALLAAFWLVPSFGATTPVLLAAGLNAAIGLAAIALARGEAPPAPPVAASEPGAATGGRRGLLFACVGLAGFAAMALETAWIRLLAIATTSSAYSFAVMLASFIGGIALGAWIVRRWAPPGGDPLRQFGLAEALAGAAVLLTLPFYERLPYLFVRVAALVRPAAETFLLVEGAKALLCLALMLPPTVLIGMTLPLASRAAARAFGEVGTAVGRVFAVNTLGNVAGALLGGLVLLPLLGLRGALEAAAGVALLAGALAATSDRGTRDRAGAIAAIGLWFACYRLFTPPWDVALANFGASRWSGPPPASFAEYEAAAVGGATVVAHYDDAHASAVVLDYPAGFRSLKVNGKPDASTGGPDMVTQVTLGQLPALLAAAPRHGLIVGLGSGVSAGSALTHPLERLDVVEISDAVAKAARHFGAANHQALDDPRLRLHVDDAFHHLAVARGRYDFIMSEPSNPWMAGVPNLFTADFYALAKARLAPDGVFVQWLHTYMSDDATVALVLRTMAASFPHVELWQAREGTDVMLVGRLRPRGPDFDALRARLARPAVAADLARVGIHDLPTLLSLQLASDARVRELAGDGPLNTLDRPSLEAMAPVAAFAQAGAHALWARDERVAPDPAAPARLALPRYVAARGRALAADEYAAMVAFHASGLRRAEGLNPGAALLAAWRRDHPADARPVRLMVELLQPAGAAGGP